MPDLREAAGAEAGEAAAAEAHEDRATERHAAPDAVTADDAVAGRWAMIVSSRGAPYLPAGQRAADAIAANPGAGWPPIGASSLT